MNKTYPELTNLAPYNLNKMFMEASEIGDIELISYLLTSHTLSYHPDIHLENDYVLRTACVKGFIDMAKYVLSSLDLKEHSDIHAFNDYALRYAIKNKHYDIAKYLLTSTELKEKANLCADRHNITEILIKETNETLDDDSFEMIKYLVSSSELTKHLNSDYDLEELFNHGIKHAVKKNESLLSFLIFEYKITPTASMLDMLEILKNVNGKHPLINIFDDQKTYFERKEFFENLDNDLSSTKSSKKKKKV